MGASLGWSVRTRRHDDLPARGAACVVEPDDGARGRISDQLHAMGFAVHETASGELGLFIATQVQLHAAIINLGLHDLNALKLVHRLRRANPTLRIVALAGEARNALPSMLARFAGADAVLAAPPSNEAVCAALADAKLQVH